MIPNMMLQVISQFLPNANQFQNAKSPDELAQMLLNSGRVNQSQVNQAKQLWQRPDIQRMVGQKFKF